VGFWHSRTMAGLVTSQLCATALLLVMAATPAQALDMPELKLSDACSHMPNKELNDCIRKELYAKELLTALWPTMTDVEQGGALGALMGRNSYERLLAISQYITIVDGELVKLGHQPLFGGIPP
jgi:hypothetical protein